MGRNGIRTLIVDDEAASRRLLKGALKAFPQILVIGEAEDGKQALDQISTQRPDVIFLSLPMPSLGGLDVLRGVSKDHVPTAVIVSSSDRFALDAFNAGAIDYLLKPIDITRLRKAVERAGRLFAESSPVGREMPKAAAGTFETPLAPKEKILGRNGNEYILLEPGEILALQADAELVWIVTAELRLRANQTLHELGNRLSHPFQRVHRNTIVNLNHIRKISGLSSQRWRLTLSNGFEVVVSKRQAREIRQLLRW